MTFTARPLYRCNLGAVVAGHYLAAEAGQLQLREGGNAIDAAAAASFALTVLEPHLGGLAGEVPILIHSARDERVVAISGQGPAPAAMSIERFRELGVDVVPGDGLLPATVPALVDAWILALRDYGTRTLADVLAPAIELADTGWPVSRGLARFLSSRRQRFTEEWPTTARIFVPGSTPPRAGDRVRNPDLAATLRELAAAAAAAPNREDGLEAAHRAFYAGRIAERIDLHSRTKSVLDASGEAHGGLLRLADLSAYRGRIEEPLSVPYRNTVVFKCSSWTQGPVFLQQLRMLEGFDLAAMGHNSTEYLHTWLEVNKLCMADREAHYGDPEFADVPFETLLSAEYAEQRRGLIDPQSASRDLRPGLGGVAASDAGGAESDSVGEPSSFLGDTTQVEAVDRFGNFVAATPSGGWIGSSPVIDGLGFPLGTRGQMVSLDPSHPNALHPGKRPRATLTPSLATKDGRPWMAFGTPGGDMQDQWTLQFFLNVVDFSLDPQVAIEAPTVSSYHAPASFYPRAALPAHVKVESRMAAETIEGLRARGHDVAVNGPWDHGRVQAIAREASGFFAAAVSPRLETGYVAGW